ncbi:hypothetical protein [Kutzneria kofuensis]|uniref:Uncharacterized protein n=1 Tax=Kutzneria kofuensis TaxID=103725 RepID=A0A7W9KHZ4_9PSEU|nr:hypothetical protein [Kutzneria kofuensis]MBB5892901.1 hypothetical protein [Kutzneria kofuensis]
MTARLPDGRVPRGFRPDGMVRTTGWLQVGRVPISTGIWPAAAFGLMALPFDVPWLPFPCAAAGFALWQVWIRYVQPSSPAVNLDSVPASDLRPGDWFRPYGGIGPAAQVAETRPAPDDLLHVSLRGGRELTLSPDYRVRRVRLRS